MTGLSSLANRLFVAMALLAVLSIAAVTYYATSAVTAQAEAELNRGLYEAGTLVEEHRRLLLDHFSREARLVADLPKLKAVVSENDPPTVQPIASDYQRELGADFFLVTNSRQQELARIAAGEQNGILQVVSVPIYIGEVGPELLLGTLTVGFALDGRTADRFKALTNSEVIFAADGSIRAGTLPPATWPTLAPLLAKEGITPSVRIGGGDYVVLSRALPPYEAAIAGVVAEAAPKTTAIILRSRTERLGFLSGIHRTVLLMAVGAILAATLASYAISRSVTRPLGTVTHAMRQMASTGDLTHRIRLPSGARWEDEDARLLASTFNTMTDSIERFSREAAQRERLSSLGRLSMVVAHEIRNPLMIIKTSLRALRAGTAGPDQIRATVHDIDEEVERLNRIVSEVLDFAKPIKFDVGPVDVNALCRDAAHAVSADSGSPQLRLDLAGDLPIVDSDAEKLRLALINVLTNARAAVETAGPQHRPDAIRITTTWPAPGTLRIRVSDRGAGIAPEDLPRIFDPFFTTRRAGTGLGLAITRNIIEGLGGTISVSSNPGRGTDVTIELSADRTDRSANSIDSSERNEGRVGAREEQLS